MADDWDRMLRRVHEACAGCGRRLKAGMDVVASLVVTDEGFERQDRCEACFDALPEEPFSFWRMRRPARGRRGPARLDLAYLSEFFKRLDGRTDEHSVKVAWLVGLLLLRKKVVELVERKLVDGRETLVLRFKREDRTITVTDPQLTDEATATIHEDLARIFNLEQEEEKGGCEGSGGGDAREGPSGGG